MQVGHRYGPVWEALRSAESHLALRIGVSFAAGTLLAGLALLVAWVLGLAAGARYLPDELVALALLGATLVWFVALRLIWRRVLRARTLVRPIIGTLVIGVLTGLGCFVVDEVVRYEDEYLMTALALCGGALLVFIWLSALQRLIQGRPVLGPDSQVDVHCPCCGYSLIGLRELRCPECGTRFTIDELIRAQHYARPEPQKDTVTPPKSTHQTLEPE